MQMNKYLTPQDFAAAEQMAGIDDPEARIDSYAGQQAMVNSMGVKNLQQYGNGRVIAPTSAWDAAGGIARNAAQAYGNKMLQEKYGSILDQNNLDRQAAARNLAAKYRVDALRNPQLTGEAVPMAGDPNMSNMG